MQKKLVYGGEKYPQFLIDANGNVTNKKTNHTYKNHLDYQGYLVVSLPMGQRGKVKIVKIHKAIAETFIPNPYNLPFVNHIDEDKANCSIDNLEWVTPKENTNKHWAIQRQKNPMCNNRKLTIEDVRTIRTSKMSYRSLSRLFKVSKTTISKVARGILYQEVI